MRVAIGLKARTGRAILVPVGGDPRELAFVERVEFRTLPEGAFAPYHAAAELQPADAQKSVERDIAIAHELAEDAIRDAAKRLAIAGHDITGVGVLLGPGMPRWTTAQIVAVHIRMHQAEGELFRNVLVAGAKACGLKLTTLHEKSALDEAAQALGSSRARLDAMLAALGKQARAPWAKDQKEAAAAALAALVANSAI